MSLNLSSTTPAAPSGRVNVAWQKDSAGNVSGNVPAAAVTSVSGRTGDVVLAESDISGLSADLAAKAPLASPALTGTPTAPTTSTGDSSTKIATTALVDAKIAALVNSAPSTLDTLGEIAAQLASDESAASALATTVASKAPLASPALTGTPTAPTPTNGDNSTQIATTAFVHSFVASGAPVTTVAGRTGDIVLGESDITGLSTDLAAKEATSNKGAANGYAPLGSDSKVPSANLPLNPVSIGYSLSTKPDTSDAVYILFPVAATFSSNFAGSYGKCTVNPTSTAVYTIKKNGSTVGTISISTSGVFTFATVGGTTVSFAVGDELGIIPPSPQDATLSGPRFTVIAYR